RGLRPAGLRVRAPAGDRSRERRACQRGGRRLPARMTRDEIRARFQRIVARGLARADEEQRAHFARIRSLPPPPDECDDEGHPLTAKRRFSRFPATSTKPKASRKATAKVKA